MAQTSPSSISYTKLRDGSWGLRVVGSVHPGSVVTVTTKAGATKTETVGVVVWSGNGVTLATIGARERQSSGTNARMMPRDGQVYAGARGGVRHATGSNRHAGGCERCGQHLQAGAGRLEYCVEDSGCRTHHDEGGYHLYCADANTCEERRASVLAERLSKKQQTRAASAAWAAAVEMMPIVTERPAWTKGATPIATWHAPVMAHTGAYPRIYRTETDACYYVPGYFACDWDTPAIYRTAPLTPALDAAIQEAAQLASAAGLLKAQS